MGVFHDLAPLCIQAMKDSLFGIVQKIEDSEDEEASEPVVEEEKLGNEAIEDVLSQAAAILNNNDNENCTKGKTYFQKVILIQKFKQIRKSMMLIKF